MASISPTADAAAALVVRGADQNIGVAATLLKKIDQADKNLVATLLPSPPPPTAGRLNISA